MKVVILSDIHGNLSALEAVVKRIEDLQDLGIAVLLGDVVDYGMHSNEVVQIIQSFTCPIACSIWGNHERVMFTQEYERFSSERGRLCAQYTRSILTQNSWNYVKNTMHPEGMKEFSIEGKKCLAIHGSMVDMYWGSIKPGEDHPIYARYDYVFSGHSHCPHFFEVFYDSENFKTRNKKKTVFINPGSVGQPRNLSSMAQYAVLDTKTETVTIQKVSYDVKKEQNAYTGQVDDFYKTRLENGV